MAAVVCGYRYFRQCRFFCLVKDGTVFERFRLFVFDGSRKRAVGVSLTHILPDVAAGDCDLYSLSGVTAEARCRSSLPELAVGCHCRTLPSDLAVVTCFPNSLPYVVVFTGSLPPRFPHVFMSAGREAIAWCQAWRCKEHCQRGVAPVAVRRGAALGAVSRAFTSLRVGYGSGRVRQALPEDIARSHS